MVPDAFPLFPNSPPADFTSLAGGAIPKAYLSRSGKGEGLRMFKRLVKHGNSLALVIDRVVGYFEICRDILLGLVFIFE